MQWLLDPKLFNYTILALYAFSAIRWGIAGNYADMFYWMGAFWITSAVTFGYGH